MDKDVDQWDRNKPTNQLIFDKGTKTIQLG